MARSSFIDSNGSIEGGDFWRPDYSLSPLFRTPPKAAAHAHCMFKGLQNNLHQLFRSVLACRSTTRMASSKPAVEIVTDYPRPPRLEETKHRLRVFLDGVQVADTQRGYRVLETFHPPTYYIPPEDCNHELIVPSAGASTMCEWKGRATYFDVVLPSGLQAQRRVWAYKSPTGPFAPIAGYYSFYASPFDCFVDEEKVEPQPGDFYGGWKTSWIQGKIKGGPGTWGW